jgi:hypothetical protein
VEFYADPETYFAIGFIADPPCGDFADDFGEDYKHEGMQGLRPGRRAREAIRMSSQFVDAGAICKDAANAGSSPLTNDQEMEVFHLRQLLHEAIETLKPFAKLEPNSLTCIALSWAGTTEFTAADLKRARDVINKFAARG